MPLKGWKKDENGVFHPPEDEGQSVVGQDIEPDLPTTPKLSEIINSLKAVLQSYRHNLEVKIVEQGNTTTSIEVKIVFLIR